MSGTSGLRAIRQDIPQIESILAGTRTQMRVRLWDQPFRPDGLDTSADLWYISAIGKRSAFSTNVRYYARSVSEIDESAAVHLPLEQWLLDICPYGKPGDRLWIQEAWASVCGNPEHKQCYRYRAGYDGKDGPFAWRSAATMGAPAARILLEITAVRAEQLQAVTPDDISREGIAVPAGSNPVQLYQQRWDQQHPYSDRWADNPYLYVIDVKPIQLGFREQSVCTDEE